MDRHKNLLPDILGLDGLERLSRLSKTIGRKLQLLVRGRQELVLVHQLFAQLAQLLHWHFPDVDLSAIRHVGC